MLAARAVYWQARYMDRELKSKRVAITGPQNCDTSDLLTSMKTLAATEPESLRIEWVTTEPQHLITDFNTPGDPPACVIFVVSAVEGDGDIDDATTHAWEACAERNVPRIIVISHSEDPDADFEDVVTHCQAALDEAASIVAVQLPLYADGAGVGGILDLLTESIYDYSVATRSGAYGRYLVIPAEPEHLSLITDDRDRLLEGIATESADPHFIENLISGHHFDAEVVQREFIDSVRGGRLYPVVFHASHPSGFGTDPLLQLLRGCLS